MTVPFWSIALAIGTSFLLTLWLVWSAGHHAHLSADHDLSGPQKFHVKAVPRIGGIGIAAGVCAVAATHAALGLPEGKGSALLMLCALPAFGAGLVEDLTKKVSARVRLVATMLAAGLACGLLDAVISRTDIPGLDWVAAYPVGAVTLAVLVVAGTANAVNIIDGFNGLASMCSMLIFAGITYVAFTVGDMLVAHMALACLAAILGFFVFNYPAGLIFLGDGGAYFVGFMMAETALLLVHRNAEVSPLFALLVCFYPIFEMLFSMYRRRVLRNVPSMAPDGIHLHSLIYRRMMRWAAGDRTPRAMTRRNSMTSPYLWAICAMSIAPAMVFWNNTAVLAAFLGVFVVSYVSVYARIVRFKTPPWMVFWR